MAAQKGREAASEDFGSDGSHRGEAGFTQWLLDKLAEGALGAGAEFETVVLAKQKIKPCLGCEVCHTAEHLLHCVYEQEDDVQAILAKMRAADILIYATPVYVFSMTGIMKTFLDRLNSTAGGGKLCLTESGLFFHHIDKSFHSKPFVVLTCCGNVEEETVKNVISYFKTFGEFLDAPIVGILARKSVGMLEESKAMGLEKQKPVIAEVINAYVQAGKELATRGRIAAKTERQANQPILGIPFFDVLMKFRYFKKIAIRNKEQKGDKNQ